MARRIDADALHWRMGLNQDDEQIFYVTGEDIDAASTCKTTFPGDFDGFRYCPNCGAKMEDESDGDVRC